MRERRVSVELDEPVMLEFDHDLLVDPDAPDTDHTVSMSGDGEGGERRSEGKGKGSSTDANGEEGEWFIEEEGSEEEEGDADEAEL